MTTPPHTTGRRGGPLVMLALLVTVWAGGRALWWENPFAALGEVLGQPLAAADAPFITPSPTPFISARPTMANAAPDAAMLAVPAAALGLHEALLMGDRLPQGINPPVAAPRQLIRFAALHEAPVQASEPPQRDGAGASPAMPEPLPYLPPALPQAASDRWSLDTWAFWRDGSGAAPISQGRLPIYGASQAGAVLQYRLAPGASRDPRVYARAYRALVRRGEQELALGASARPMGWMPVRVAAEVRYTDAAFTDELRPSAYAVTEFAPVALPYAMRFDAYAQAGWVGGASATVFADGQASVTREVRTVAAATDNAVRLSIGAGAWGGAQNDAQRFDVGPTMRFDLTVGGVPARISLDWRERVGGQAGPNSGLAATLSTRF